MATVKANLDLCQGYANCVMSAGDYFDMDDDGKVILLTIDVPESELRRVEDAVRSCPASALVIED